MVKIAIDGRKGRWSQIILAINRWEKNKEHQRKKELSQRIWERKETTHLKSELIFSFHFISSEFVGCFPDFEQWE